MMDSDKDATIAQFLRWSHASVHEAEELVDIVRSDAEAADVHFDESGLFEELVLALDKFVSGIKEVYEKIGAEADNEEEPAAETAPPAADGAERAA